MRGKIIKKVSFDYGCRALGYSDGEFFVEEGTPDDEVRAMVEDKIGFYVDFTTVDGYEEQTEVVYRKV